MCVEGVQTEALVDTGASLSVISTDLCSRLRKVKTPYDGPPLRCANAVRIQPSGVCTARVFIDGILHHIQFAVLSSCTYAMILGWDFLSSASALISCRQRTIHMTDTGSSSAGDAHSQRFVACTDCVVPPGSEHILTLTSDTIVNGDVVLAPSGRCISGGLSISPSLVRFQDGRALIAVRNPTSAPVVLSQGTAVTCFTDTEPLSLVPLHTESPPLSTGTDDHVASAALTAAINPDLTAAQKEDLMALLQKHSALFDVHSKLLGRTSVAVHRIETEGTSIVRRRPYRVSSVERKIIADNVDDMLKRDIIRPSSSSWSSPVVLVRKKDGSVRFCVDYRALNKITRKDVYPMPRIDDAIDSLQGAEYFSSLDLRSGYWQIPMHEADKEKTAFATPDGLYEFNVMPFGLCNAPATFERMIDTVLRGLKWKTCLCYLDDIVIFSTTFRQHLERLDDVLTCISNAGLQLNTKKCHFARTNIKVLGHLISKDGVRPDPDKVAAVIRFPRPENQKQLRSFLGLASYFRRFISHFAAMASPLHKLLTSGTAITWTDDCERSFQALKQALTSDPVLCHFDENAPTCLHTDASGHGIGAVLLQRDTTARERVVAYASRALTAAEQNYSITEQECLAVVWAIQKFRPYLYGRHFTVITDHHALCWLSSLKNLSGRLGRWVVRLQEYDFDVVYKSGKKHQDADALSRCPLPLLSSNTSLHSAPLGDETMSPLTLLPLAVTETPSSNRGTQLASCQRSDPYCSSIIQRLCGNTPAPNARLRRQLRLFKLDNDVLHRYIYNTDGHRWVPVLPRSLRTQILEAFHDDPSAGHLGFHKTYHRVRSRFFWPGMSTFVAKYVASCVQCQRRKRPTSPPAGLLQPIPCPETPFATVGIDLVGPLPLTPSGYRWIVTAVDHLTRYAETAPLRSSSASDVADFFLDAIVLRHGAPRVLLSDRGKTFLSTMIEQVLRACGTVHKTTSAYHPQTNGLTERFHRTLTDMISMYIGPSHDNWDKLLPFVTFAHNTAVQRTTGYSPFYLVYGRSPTFTIDAAFLTAPTNTSASIPEQFVSRLEECRDRARFNTEVSQLDRKQRCDLSRRDVSFRPGDEVLLWTPIRTPGLCEKFESRFLGPYIIDEQTSPVNYRVTPVEVSSDHRCRGSEIVHVSRLKRFVRRFPPG